jgi:hypothetical protein
MEDWPVGLVAVHESAHAVVSALLGHAVREVTIADDGEVRGATLYANKDGQPQPVAPPPREDPCGVDLGDDAALFDVMVVCAAGRAGVIAFGWPDEMADASARTDLKLLAQCALGMSAEAFLRAPYRAHATAASYVRRHKAAIAEVAGALLVSPTGRLTGDQVRAIVSRHQRAPDPEDITGSTSSPSAQP